MQVTAKPTGALIAALLATAGVVHGQESFEFRLASFANDGDTFGLAQAKLAEELETRSDGRITLSVFNIAVLPITQLLSPVSGSDE